MKDMTLEEKEMEILINKMFEMANAPREEFGERQPGERNMYELSNLKGERTR